MNWLTATYHSLPDLTFERFLAGLDIGISVSLLVIGWKALDQLKIAKKDISTRVAREAAKETAIQLEAWATRIFARTTETRNALAAAGVQLVSHAMVRFDAEELAGAPTAIRNHAAAFQAAMPNNNTYGAVIDLCNAMEASAMHFETGIADEEIAFRPLGHAFCSLVEQYYPHYCAQRSMNSSDLNRWHYTILLYTRWSQRRKLYSLDAQQEVLAQERADAAKGAAPRRPLGA